MGSYVGHPPYTDEYQERLDNAEHLQAGSFGAKQVVIYDSSGNALTFPSVGSTMTSGLKTVTTAGTAVTLLASSTACKKIWIIALSTNNGTIYVGGSTVLNSSKNGFPLSPGDSQAFDITDVANVYIDSTINGEGVAFVYTV